MCLCGLYNYAVFSVCGYVVCIISVRCVLCGLYNYAVFSVCGYVVCIISIRCMWLCGLYD